MQDVASDEIDPIELIEIIWDGKWLIGAITSISVILAAAYTLILPPSFEGRLDIVALDRTQMAAFAPLNDTPGISQPIYAGDKLIGHEGVILSKDLFNAFIAELRRGQFFSKAHAELDPEFINFNGGEIEKREKLSKVGRRYDLLSDPGISFQITLRFPSGDKELARKIVTQALNATNEGIRLDNLNGISNLQSSIESSLNFEIDAIETSIANALANYEINTAARLANLAEQAAIARQLGIADNQAGLATRGTNGIGINVNTDLPLYLRGFSALEKEIALIKDRNKDNKVLLHIPNYPEMAADLRALKTDKRLERIEKSVQLTPLADARSFTAVGYDLDAMIFEPSVSKPLIVVLAALISGMIAIIFVLIRHSIVQRKQNA